MNARLYEMMRPHRVVEDSPLHWADTCSCVWSFWGFLLSLSPPAQKYMNKLILFPLKRNYSKFQARPSERFAAENRVVSAADFKQAQQLKGTPIPNGFKAPRVKPSTVTGGPGSSRAYETIRSKRGQMREQGKWSVRRNND